MIISKIMASAAAMVAVSVAAPVLASDGHGGDPSASCVDLSCNTTNVTATSTKNTTVDKTANINTNLTSTKTIDSGNTKTVASNNTTSLSSNKTVGSYNTKTTNTSLDLNVDIANSFNKTTNVNKTFTTTKIIANQDLSQVLVNKDGMSVGVEHAGGLTTGNNDISGSAFAAYSGILNQGWNTGFNANTQSANNIAALGTVSFSQ